jgi:hypothetical protein
MLRFIAIMRLLKCVWQIWKDILPVSRQLENIIKLPIGRDD